MLFQSLWFRFGGERDSKLILIGDPQMEGTRRIEHEGIYGQISVFMNDIYYKHIVNNILKNLNPTHIFVLGDIFSSQYISDSEFDLRVSRFNFIFSHPSVSFL